MAKWKLPEGRKPFTDADMAALTRRLVDTAIEQSDLYQAAKRDAEEAETYAKELEAKLKASEDFGLRLERFADQAGDTFLLQRAREFLAELKGQDDGRN